MSTLEDIKALLSRDICDWCKPYIERGEECFGCPKGDRDAMCREAKEARAQDVYERFVNPLEKKVYLLSMWTETYADYGVAMKDAAEFEARVSMKLLTQKNELRHECSRYENGKRIQLCPKGRELEDCKTAKDVARCYLRLARFAVEAEMEAEGK